MQKINTDTPSIVTMITMPELAARLNMTRHGILKWIKLGKFPRQLKPMGKYGRSYWRVADVISWEAGKWKNG